MRRCLLAAVIALVTALPCRARTAADVSRQVAELEQQIASERQLLEQSARQWEVEVSDLQRQRDEQAQAVLELESQRLRATAELVDVERQRRDKQQHRDELAGQSAAVNRSLGALAERMALIADEIPAGEFSSEKLRAAATLLRDDTAEAPRLVAAARDVFDELADLHDRAGHVRLTRAEVWTADGTRHSVKLLSVGLVAFAYQHDDSRVALAVDSPFDASGYRWTEDLPADVEAAWRRVFAAVEAGQPPGAVVIDPTGQMRVEAVAAGRGVASTLREGGPVMFPLLGVAVAALALMLERFHTLYLRTRSDSKLLHDVLDACRRADMHGAIGRAELVGGVQGRVLAACLRRRAAGLHAMEDSIQEQLLHELPRLNRFLGGLAILAAVAPLLGLLGTVTGIIQTFGVVQAFGNANPALMAGGISEALITTAAGLVIAIPILLVHSVLRARVDRVIADAEMHAATLLNVVAHDAPPPPPTAHKEAHAIHP